MSQEKFEPRPDCPRCFGTGTAMPIAGLGGGALPSAGVTCPLCLEAARKANG